MQEYSYLVNRCWLLYDGLMLKRNYAMMFFVCFVFYANTALFRNPAHALLQPERLVFWINWSLLLPILLAVYSKRHCIKHLLVSGVWIKSVLHIRDCKFVNFVSTGTTWQMSCCKFCSYFHRVNSKLTTWQNLDTIWVQIVKEVCSIL